MATFKDDESFLFVGCALQSEARPHRCLQWQQEVVAAIDDQNRQGGAGREVERFDLLRPIQVDPVETVGHQDEIIEIDVILSHSGLTNQVVEDVRRLLTEGHDHTEDFTITTQSDMLEVFGNIMDVITMGVSAIADWGGAGLGAALVVTLLAGLDSGLMPARRAAQLDPIESLLAEQPCMKQLFRYEPPPGTGLDSSKIST